MPTLVLHILKKKEEGWQTISTALATPHRVPYFYYALKAAVMSSSVITSTLT